MRSLSLRFSGLLCAYAKVDLHPLYLRCLKIHPFTSVLLARIIFSSTYPPLYRIRCLISVSLSASFLTSFVFLPLSLSLSVHPFPSRSSPSPSVSACSNMATRCPITRLVLATVFPPPFICRRPRRRKNPHQPRHPVLFFAFSFTIRSIHPYSSASIAPCSSVSYRAGYLISDINRGNHAAPSWNNGTEK